MADPAPTITVLAGTNGAGKSSIGGASRAAARAPFYNPDVETRKNLMAANPEMTLDEANAAAWGIGKERLEAAILQRHHFNFGNDPSAARRLLASWQKHTPVDCAYACGIAA